jgi:CheY-like chemotaxis protein
MKRRILLVDDDLAVLLTLKAVLELHGFEVETAASSTEAFTRMDTGVYHMVISDLRMETEDAGLEVIRRAHSQAYAPATALLTAYAPPEEWVRAGRKGDHKNKESGTEQLNGNELDGNVGAGENPDSVLIKPLGTGDLLRQVEALLVSRADKQLRQRSAASNERDNHHRAG